MAKQTFTKITDDIDGSENAKSYKFGLGDDHYEIDLSDDNYRQLEEFLSRYINAGAKVTARLPRSGGSDHKSASNSNREELQVIRKWAKDNGYQVSDRGRVSSEIQKAYHDAH